MTKLKQKLIITQSQLGNVNGSGLFIISRFSCLQHNIDASNKHGAIIEAFEVDDVMKRGNKTLFEIKINDNKFGALCGALNIFEKYENDLSWVYMSPQNKYIASIKPTFYIEAQTKEIDQIKTGLKSFGVGSSVLGSYNL